MSDTLPTLDSVNALQAAMNNAISDFITANDGVPVHRTIPTIIGSMLVFPWYWAVEQSNRTPEEWATVMKAEIDTFKDQMVKNPHAIDDSNLSVDNEE